MEGRGVMRYADGDIYEVTIHHHSHHCQEIVSLFFRASGDVGCGKEWVKLFSGMGITIAATGPMTT